MKHIPYTRVHTTQTGMSPSSKFFSQTSTCAHLLGSHLEKTMQGHQPWCPYWAHSCSFAITEEFPFWFHIPHLLICLNSAGCFAWYHDHAAHQEISCTAMQVASSTRCGNKAWHNKHWGLLRSQHVSRLNNNAKMWERWHKHALRSAPRARLRSMVDWFTEFCNSQWWLHFAAPFIIMWTKTSVAELIHEKYFKTADQPM